MTDKKFNDDEITKGLECCITFDCRNCPLGSKCNSSPPSLLPFKCALDLINRQKAKIDNLNKQVEWFAGYNENLMSANAVLSEGILLARFEAYKEFAARLRKKLSAYRRKCQIALDDESVFAIDKARQKVDNLLKEMLGEEE